MAELAAEAREVLLHGDDAGFLGVVPYLRRRVENLLRLDPSPEDEETTDGGEAFDDLRPYLTEEPCRACRGTRLRPESLAVRLAGLSVADIVRLPLSNARETLAGLAFGERERARRRAGDRRDPLAARRAARARARLPDARPRDHDALRRRGPPPAARHPDRRPHAGAALRARRAVGGPAPARQRAADPHAPEHPRRRQHGRGRRARRGDDPGGRLGDRPRRRGWRRRRTADVRGAARLDRRQPDGSLSARRGLRAAARVAARGQGLAARARRARPQPARRRRRDPARDAHGRDGRLRLGQVDARRGRAPSRARAPALSLEPGAGTPPRRSRARRRSTR